MKKQIIAILTAALTCGMAVPAAAGGAYTDLKTTNWAYPAVSALNEKGIVAGYPDGTFKPGETEADDDRGRQSH